MFVVARPTGMLRLSSALASHMSNRSISAIFFDLDGTLVDSMGTYCASVANGFEAMGATLDEDFFWEWHGKRLPWSALFDHHDVKVGDERGFEERVHRAFQERVTTEPVLMPYVRETISAIQKARIPMGIVTNAARSYVEQIGAFLHLEEWATAVITHDETQELAKPHPYGLSLAAARVGVPNRLCMYVGDQRFDVRAANAAGMLSCYLRTRHSTHVPPDAARIISSLREVELIIEQRPIPSR